MVFIKTYWKNPEYCEDKNAFSMSLCASFHKGEATEGGKNNNNINNN